MISTLRLFNPEHDLALASNSDHFDAPQSAKIFACEFAYLPMWLSRGEDAIWVKKTNTKWFNEMQEMFPQLRGISVIQEFQDCEKIIPWGWDKAICRTLVKQGFQNVLNLEQLDFIRNISHRKLSIEATKYIQKLTDLSVKLALPAKLLKEDEVDFFVRENPYAIFKAPWSGSGKGIIRSLGCLSENLLNRVKNIAKKQGSVLAEPLYTVVQNFALEFLCKNGKTSFSGYSYFFTDEHGAYKGNLLATDEYIENQLNVWIPQKDLQIIKDFYIHFFDEKIAHTYSGYLGVDMFVYQQDDEYCIHPCVEINVRMTMGLFARLFYDSFVEKGMVGTYFVDYFADSKQLIENHKQKLKERLAVCSGKIQGGYVSLTPIVTDTHYRARVEFID